MPPPTTMGTRISCSSSTSPALMACPASPAPPTVMSCWVADFSCRIMPGSKFRSIRVLAVDTDWSVAEKPWHEGRSAQAQVDFSLFAEQGLANQDGWQINL